MTLYAISFLAVTLISGKETLAMFAHDMKLFLSMHDLLTLGKNLIFFLLTKELLRQENALPPPLQSIKSISGAHTK